MTAPHQPWFRALGRRVSHEMWRANGRFGWSTGTDIDARATVLVTYYHPARLRHVGDQVRNLLRCAFVERVILSNHNPSFRLEDVLELRDPRIVVVQQQEPRGCGYRWNVAHDHVAPFMVVMDDDLLLYPWQLARVFRQLVADPSRPHGIAGMVYAADGSMRYVQGESREVDYLCELYAVTAEHVRKYQWMRGELGHDARVAASIDGAADFVLLSHAGEAAPRIHPAGRIRRDETFNQHGVAVHQRGEFGSSVGSVRAAIRGLA